MNIYMFDYGDKRKFNSVTTSEDILYFVNTFKSHGLDIITNQEITARMYWTKYLNQPKMY